MTARTKALLALAGLLLVTAARTPGPSPTAALELHRTASSVHVDPLEANPLFVLVIGSDLREGDPRQGRADALSIVAVNTATGRGTVIGIPRDSYVPVPGRGRSKINSSLQFGGPELVVETVRQLTGLPIHYYAAVEFSRFRALIDRLGGVVVDVPYPMAERFSGAFFDPGPHHMTGAEALAFSRNRKSAPGGDFGRQENIGRVLLAGLDKFRHDAREIPKVLLYLQAFREFVVSDVPTRELLHLAAVGRRLDPFNFRNIVLPGSPGQAGGASVVFLSSEINAIFDSVRHDGEV